MLPPLTQKLLKLEVADKTSTWTYAPNVVSSANGDPNSRIQIDARLLGEAPVGALIAKIGGSSAGSSDGKLFLVGDFCIIRLDDKQEGPLFLTINDGPKGFTDNSGQISVNIFEAL